MNCTDIDGEAGEIYVLLERMIKDKISNRNDNPRKEVKHITINHPSKEKDKASILAQIKKNSSGIVGRDESLASQTWIAVLGSAENNPDRVCVKVVPVDKIWTGGIHFESLICAADSIENNLNDWYKALSQCG